ncbi:hypothetical protein DITRI_Ditri03aG0002600 [Diplodiscus trichospermus]
MWNMKSALAFSRDSVLTPSKIKKRVYKLQKNDKKEKGRRDMTMKFEKLKEEMEEISKEQKEIREGQSQIGEKLEAIEKECEQLKDETNVIIKQSASTHIRLSLMYLILKARQQGHFAKAAHFTQLLRSVR